VSLVAELATTARNALLSPPMPAMEQLDVRWPISIADVAECGCCGCGCGCGGGGGGGGGERFKRFMRW